MNKAWVVTTSALGSSKTQIWDSSRPLPLGHPFQWVLENTEQGVRVRDVSFHEQGKQKNPSLKNSRVISKDLLESGAKIELGGRSPVSLHIRPAEFLVPAFQAGAGEDLIVYTCSGDWVLSSVTLSTSKTSHKAQIAKKTFFILKRESAQEYTLRCLVESLQLKLTEKGRIENRELKKGESLKLAQEVLACSTIASAHHSWRFGLASTQDFSSIDLVQAGSSEENVEQAAFRSALRTAAIGLATLIAISWIWPKAKTDPQEIIPAQYAKILLQKPKSTASASNSSGSTAPTEKIANNKELPKKVQNTAVVQAFRAKALSNAVNGLLKGGMTRLLAQSDFVMGSRADKEARRIFETRSNDLRATGPEIGLSPKKSVEVGAIGGGGSSTGAGVGYGKGTHAGVKGQGGSFVTMDTSGSSVEEGLTKDEVGEVIHKHLSEVRYCYESAMIRTPDLEGKLMVSFTISGNGVVKSSEVKSSTLPDPRLDDCILRRLGSWKFPSPRGKIDVAVTYPFIFKSLGR